MSNGIILDEIIKVTAVETSGPGTAPIINGPRVPTDSSGDVPVDETDPEPEPFTGSITIGIEGPNVSGSVTEIPEGTRLSIQASTDQFFYANVMEDGFFQFEDFGTIFNGVAMEVLYAGPPEFRSRTFYYDNPPVFAGVEVLRFEVMSVGDGKVTLYLGLSENRPARILYGTTSALGLERIVTTDANLGNDANAPHIYALDGLTNGQVYYFQMDDPVDGSYTTSIIQGTPNADGVIATPRLVLDTVISDVTDTSLVASITFAEGAKIQNLVDTVNPPVTQYSASDDYNVSEHHSPVYGLTPNTTYYIQQIGELIDGTFVSGTVRTQTTLSDGASGDTRIVNNTTVTDVTTTGFILRIDLSEGAKVTNFVDTVTPPLLQYSKQDDFEISEHAATVTGRSANTTYYVRQDMEYLDGFTESGAIRTQKTADTVVIPDSNVLRPPQFTSAQSGWAANNDGVIAYQEQRTETNAGFASGTTIRRVSPAGKYHPYSKRAAINADSTRVVASGKIYNTSDGADSGYYIGIGPRNEFNWSHIDPDVVMGIGNDEKSFVKRNVVTGVTTTLKTWSEYTWMSVGDFEGMQSNNDRYVVLIGHFDSALDGPREHVSFDIQTSTVLGKITANGEDNWSGFSQDGEFILVEGNNYGVTSPTYNMRFYDKNFNLIRTVYRKPEHGDWGVDYLGQQCYVMETGYGLNYVIANTGAVEEICSTGMQWGHLSCRNIKRPGYLYHSNGDSGGPIIEVEIKPSSQSPKFALYGLPRASGVNGVYNDYAMGCPNQDASMVAYHSDYQQGGGNDGVFEMLLKLPPA